MYSVRVSNTAHFPLKDFAADDVDEHVSCASLIPQDFGLTVAVVGLFCNSIWLFVVSLKVSTHFWLMGVQKVANSSLATVSVLDR